MLRTILPYIIFLLGFHSFAEGKITKTDSIQLEFLGKDFTFPLTYKIEKFHGNLNQENIINYAASLETCQLDAISKSLSQIQKKESLDDWIFYQLVRKASHELIKKSDDYIAYTLCKWFFLKKAGFEPMLSFSNNKLLMYIKSEDIIYNQPIKTYNNVQYVCLNYHDYGYNVDFNSENFINLLELLSEGNKFSFKIKELPDFEKSNYLNKEIVFKYKQQEDKLNIKVNPKIGSYFTNYPVMDYENQFNIPLSKETYESLIPALKEKTKKLSVNKGVEYLMYFTRHAFLFERDTEIFGREKRFSPEETLLYEKSDCEDRSALFYLLVKELYNLPMIVITLSDHVTVAVKLNQVNKNAVIYKGESFTICEPTPQKKELRLGQTIANLNKKSYDVVYFYEPKLR